MLKPSKNPYALALRGDTLADLLRCARMVAEFETFGQNRYFLSEIQDFARAVIAQAEQEGSVPGIKPV